MEKLDLATVMLSYGVSFVYSPKNAEEVQYRCPFHGKDNRPSARYYRKNNSCYCWFCKKKWTVIGFIQDKEKLHYLDTLLYIIDKYRIDTSVIPDDPEIKAPEKPVLSEDGIMRMQALNRLLDLRGKIPLEKYALLTTAYQMISYQKNQGISIDVPLTRLLEKLGDLRCQNS